MNREQLHSEIIKLLPSHYDKEDGFLSHLDNRFSRYLELLYDLDEPIIEYESLWDNGKREVVKHQLIKRISSIISSLRDAANDIYSGCHAIAYIKIRDVIQNGMNDCPLKRFSANSTFYRMRAIKDSKNVDIHDMFHIPLNKRGIVRTQRYSTPGYPCLYLGESVYVCWEELQKPDLKECYASKLENQHEIFLLDLTIPELSDWLPKQDSNDLSVNQFFISSLLRLPLLMACMVQVQNKEHVFKPEYIFSQLVMEMITYQVRKMFMKKELLLFEGIYYTTVCQDSNSILKTYKDSNNPRFVNNIAIPVLEPNRSTKYCPELCALFKITEPICDRSVGTQTEYSMSTFNHLEEELDKLELQSIDPQFYSSIITK